MDEQISEVIQDARRAVKAREDDLPLAPNGFQAATLELLVARLVVAVERLQETIESEGTATRSQLQSR